MHTILMAAGNGYRFEENPKYRGQFKPFIEVKGKTILEHTLDSIFSYTQYLSDITFAIRTEHDKTHQITEKLTKRFGSKIKFKYFNKLTRGNLETAFISSLSIKDKNQDLLLLDSDNKYTCPSNFFSFIHEITDVQFAVLCYFDRIDESEKWCFADIDGFKVTAISEKDSSKLKNPKSMVGTFYFSSIHLFLRIAEDILKFESPVKNEFYMSMTYNYCLKNNVPVYGFKVENIWGLGTPEDVEKFELNA